MPKRLKEGEGFATIGNFAHWLKETHPELNDTDTNKIVEEVKLMLGDVIAGGIRALRDLIGRKH